MVTSSSGSYTVLARRFRPQGFADVVGQEHIARALRNAILANRVAHAYLFTGARGVGKTSTARILAKALNCPQSVEGNPCNKCEVCDGIAAGNDVDVLEIDGASNNGVENIRQLRANVNVSSMRSRYKVYIIDEVHMLSTSAFNALLKTLEEPPPNVKFVFCTTEPHKIPDTILSRCQRFDFGTIETANIKALLAHIALSEGVNVQDDALELVARRAAGSMRDSQSIFDQLLAFGEENISAADVHRLLGTASDDRLIDIGQALIDRDKAKAIDSFHAALDGGVQLGELTDQLLFYLRDLMILASEAASVGLLSVAPVSRELLQNQARTWGLQTIVAAMQILSDTKGRMQRVTYGRALAELALVRIAMLEDLTGIGELIDKLRSGEPVSVAQTQSSPASAEKKNDVAPARPQHKDASPEGLSAEAAEVSAEPSGSPGAVPPVASSELVEVDQPLVAESLSADSAESSVRIVSASTDVVSSGIGSPQTEPDAGQVAVRNTVEFSDEPAGSGHPDHGTELATSDYLKDPGPAQADSAVAASESAGSGMDDVQRPESKGGIPFLPENADRIWAQVLPEINDMLKSHVKSVSSVAISAPNKLELTLPPKYHFGKTYLEKPEAQSRLQQIVAGLTGVEPRITVVLSDVQPVETVTSAADSGGRQSKRVFKPEEDEFVCSVVEVFSAQVVRIDPLIGGADGAGDNEVVED